ncbi:LmeA family phospholipid-binding protein [Streptomyces sp. NPDC001514]
MRALRILLITAVILGGLFAIADRLAVNFAESEVAAKVRSSQGLTSEPEVSINGFPFLTQVASSELDDVEVRLGGVKASAGGHSVEVTEVAAELSGVRLDGFSSAVADRAAGSARISYEDLGKSAPEGATVSYAGPERAAKGQVKVTGPAVELLEGAGFAIPGFAEALLEGRTLTTYSTVSISGGDTVTLRAEELPKLPVPGMDRTLRKAVDYDLKIDGLPSTIKLDKVTADEGGLRFSGVGTDVSLAG